MHKVDYFIQNKNLLSVEIDDELVMISDDQKKFMALNSTGKFIFDYLTSPQSRDEIIAAVLSHFDVDKADALADIQDYLQQLISHRVLNHV